MSEKQVVVVGWGWGWGYLLRTCYQNSGKGQGCTKRPQQVCSGMPSASFLGEARVNVSDPVFSIILCIDFNLNPFERVIRPCVPSY